MLKKNYLKNSVIKKCWSTLTLLNQFPSPKTEMESKAAKIGRTVYLYEVPSADRWNDHAAGFKSITRPLFKF